MNIKDDMNIENALVVSPMVEESQSTALVEKIDGSFVKRVEEIAANIVPVRKAMEKIMTEMTYRDDWVTFGDKAALGSAGAGRLMKAFPFVFTNWSSHKEEWDDEFGDAYRWVYQCECELYGSKVLVTGKYSTRDSFLGKAHSEWKPLSQINENNIRTAAQHICIGAGIKELLGLRNIPLSELNRIFRELEREGKQTKTAGYESKPSADVSDIKQKIHSLLQEMVGDDLAAMKNLVAECSSFEGKDGNTKAITSLANCKNEKWLKTTYGKLQQRHRLAFDDKTNAVIQEINDSE